MTVPDYAGTLSAPGLTEEVEVVRDSFGMAHIYAASDPDAYFAMGYCQAQDRLFQMDLARRAGHGRLAEILGEKLVPVDKLFRTLGAALPQDEWQPALSPEVRGSLEAFAGGVNFFLETRTRPLPVEFLILGYEPGPWSVADSMAVMLYMDWSNNYAYFKMSQGFAVQGGGASYRHIVDFADMTHSSRILPGGVSGNVMSPHYDDQIGLWLAGRTRPFVLDREAVLRDARHRLALKP